MVAVFIVVWAALLIETAFGGCHTGEVDPQWLGLQTSSDTGWASTNDALYANIYAAGQWQGWKYLDNAGCNDYQGGAWDYFDDFETLTSKWEVMALCMLSFFVCCAGVIAPMYKTDDRLSV